MKMKQKLIVSGILMALGATAYADDLTISVDKPEVNLTVGQTATVTFTLQDTSGQGATVTLGTLQDTKANFAGTVILTSSTCSNGKALTPNQSCQMIYQYQPTQAASAQPLTLTAAYTAGVTQSSASGTSTLSATAVPPSAPKPATLNFIAESTGVGNTANHVTVGSTVTPTGRIALAPRKTALAVTCPSVQGSGTATIDFDLDSTTWDDESGQSLVQIQPAEKYKECNVTFNCSVTGNQTILSPVTSSCIKDQQYYFDASSSTVYILS